MPSSRPQKKAVDRVASKSPAEVAPGVFVGAWKDAVTFDGARFCVLDEAPEDMPAGTHVPIYDEKLDQPIRQNLDRLAVEIRSARSKGSPVLVFCGHGVRRSPLAVAWYIHRAEGVSLQSAFERVRAVRPQIELPSSWIGDTASLDGE